MLATRIETAVPQQLHTCESCDGTGILAHGITVYEAGCAYSHGDTDERSCPDCGGSGFDEVVDVEPDDEESDDFRNAPWGEHSQFGVGA